MANRDDELARLRVENLRLAGLLEAHGISWQALVPARTPSADASLSTDEKVALFRRLFRGRTDVYPIRWESKAGKSGYLPSAPGSKQAALETVSRGVLCLRLSTWIALVEYRRNPMTGFSMASRYAVRNQPLAFDAGAWLTAECCQQPRETRLLLQGWGPWAWRETDGAVTTRRSDGLANCSRNAGWRSIVLIAAYMTMPRHTGPATTCRWV